MKKIKLSILAFFLIINISSIATVRYVKADATGANDGTSWVNAFTDLQSAIDIAVKGDQIWIAAGTYKPTKDPFGNINPADSRDKTFHLVIDVEVYGGFIGTETILNDRAGGTTILSGDIGISDSTKDNCYHVVLSVNDSNSTKLDGLTITNGNANGTGYITVDSRTVNQNLGGGLLNVFSSPNLYNIIVTSNKAVSGAGIYNYTSSPKISNSTISDNVAKTSCGGMSNFFSSAPRINGVFFKRNTSLADGGAIMNSGSLPSISLVAFIQNSAVVNGGAVFNYNNTTAISFGNVIFNGNSAPNGNGGGMYNWGSKVSLVNAVFTGNAASSRGGAIYNLISSPDIVNVTFSGNTAMGGGGAIFSFGTTLQSSKTVIKNGVFWGNTKGGSATIAAADVDMGAYSNFTATYTLMQLANDTNNYKTGTFLNLGAGNNLFAQNPLFVNPNDPDGADNNLLTADDGLSLQKGSPCINAGSSFGIGSYDITGFDRNGGDADMGAYEYQASSGINTLGMKSWSFYPNPSSGLFNLEFSNEMSFFTIEIYNTLGILIHKESVTDKSIAIDLRTEANGLYIVKIITDNRSVLMQRLVKE